MFFSDIFHLLQKVTVLFDKDFINLGLDEDLQKVGNLFLRPGLKASNIEFFELVGGVFLIWRAYLPHSDYNIVYEGYYYILLYNLRYKIRAFRNYHYWVKWRPLKVKEDQVLTKWKHDQ